jgi:hypothetical protein
VEGLLGILVGAILGFFLGEIKTRSDRQRSRTDLAEALLTEISLDKKGLENALEAFTDQGGRDDSPDQGARRSLALCT